jgi:asparagine synthase (glutamine-hydrolysing)
MTLAACSAEVIVPSRTRLTGQRYPWHVWYRGFSGRFYVAFVVRMNATLAHRRPDDAGTLWIERGNVGLAHRHLAIVDLPATGHEPMRDADGTMAVVFNGEIYNYHQLRADSVSRGYEFRGQFDREVLLNLYRQDGESILERLHGIVAFAIWDSRDRSLVVAGDDVEVIPFHYA